MSKNCPHCGKKVRKSNHSHCFECDCTKQFIKKGAQASSTQQVKALKKVRKMGWGWLDTFSQTVKNP